MLNPTYIVLEVIIAIFAVLGNILVCWAVCQNTNLQNATNYFVVSLAAADIAVGLLGVPFAIVISVGFSMNVYGCLFIACFVLVLTQSSIFSLLAIAVDRFIAIKMPLRYKSVVTNRRARMVIAMCWMLSVVIGLMPMFGWNRCTATNSSCRVGKMKCYFEEVITMNYMVYFNFFVCVLVPLLIMLLIYICIFVVARQQLKRMEVNSDKSRSFLMREFHAAKSLAVLVGLFATCWLPLHIINCFLFFCRQCPRPHPVILQLAIVLTHANSVVNPLIYAYRIREFRFTFRRIINRHLLNRNWKSSSSHRNTTSWRISMTDTFTSCNLIPGSRLSRGSKTPKKASYYNNSLPTECFTSERHSEEDTVSTAT